MFLGLPRDAFFCFRHSVAYGGLQAETPEVESGGTWNILPYIFPFGALYLSTWQVWGRSEFFYDICKGNYRDPSWVCDAYHQWKSDNVKNLYHRNTTFSDIFRSHRDHFQNIFPLDPPSVSGCYDLNHVGGNWETIVLGVHTCFFRTIGRSRIGRGIFRPQRHRYGLKRNFGYVTLFRYPWRLVWYHVCDCWVGIA